MHWNSYFKLGIVHFMLYPDILQTPDRIIETINPLAMDSYFGAIEICGKYSPAATKEIRNLVDSVNLKLIYGTQPLILGEKLNLASGEEKKRLHAINRIKEAVDYAYELNAQHLVIMDGYNSYQSSADEEEQIKYLKEALHEICAYTQSQGEMAISVENYDRNIEKNCLLGPSELTAKVLQDVKSDHCCLGMTLDLAHLGLLHEDIGKVVQQTKDTVNHIHLGNCVLKRGTLLFGDSHPRFGIPEGAFNIQDIASFLASLLKAGVLYPYNVEPPVVSFEISPLEGEQPEWIVAHCKRIIDHAWALLI